MFRWSTQKKKCIPQSTPLLGEKMGQFIVIPEISLAALVTSMNSVK